MQQDRNNSNCLLSSDASCPSGDDMERFVLRENIALFERYSQVQSDGRDRDFYRQMLFDARRKLAVLEAASVGVRAISRRPHRIYDQLGWVGDRFNSSLHPCLVLDPGMGLHIVGVNDAYAEATMTTRALIKGQSLFDVFPDNPGNPAADGVYNLYESLLQAAETGKTHAMPVQRYDMRDLRGSFVERYWLMINIPLFDGQNLVCLLHRVVDVTKSTKYAHSTDGPGAHSTFVDAVNEDHLTYKFCVQ
jgi:hypothetical protein